MEILFFLAALLAEIVGTIAGFGSSTIFLPLALLFVDFRTALILVALFHIFGNLGRISFFQHWQFKPTLVNSIVGGGLSGFLAGLIGTGGALRGAFLTSFGLPKEK